VSCMSNIATPFTKRTYIFFVCLVEVTVAVMVDTVREVTAAMAEIEAMAEIAVETAVTAEAVEEESHTVAGITAEVLNTYMYLKHTK